VFHEIAVIARRARRSHGLRCSRTRTAVLQPMAKPGNYWRCGIARSFVRGARSALCVPLGSSSHLDRRRRDQRGAAKGRNCLSHCRLR
jgi:hypothetical protein